MKIKIKIFAQKHKNFAGFFDYPTNTILIRKDLHFRDKIGVFIHELGHYFIYKLFSKDLCGKFNGWNLAYDIIDTLLDKKALDKHAEIKWYINYYYPKQKRKHD
jgi:hypothetical protein